MVQPDKHISTDSTNSNNKQPNSPKNLLLRQKINPRQKSQPTEDSRDTNDQKMPKKYPDSTREEAGDTTIKAWEFNYENSMKRKEEGRTDIITNNQSKKQKRSDKQRENDTTREPNRRRKTAKRL